jgi:hypothetical protein
MKEEMRDMNLNKRLKNLEGKIPNTLARKNYTPEELRAESERVLTMSDEELSGGMFTAEQLRRMSQEYLLTVEARS